MFLQWKSDLLTFLLVKSLRWKHSWKITKTQNEKCLVYLHIYHIKYIIPNQASSFLTKYVLVQSLTTKLPTPNFPNHSDLSWRYNSTKITWNLFVSVNAKNTQVVPDRKFLTLITIVVYQLVIDHCQFLKSVLFNIFKFIQWRRCNCF